ncbi:HFL107Cp [Eremothecium sinecaudum]|uniref:HFL107Cp n=1 Tax=Eremothecium sinecaudum TaxID=45286 RepID=A0A0X8HUI4_9SACH|nr:HFL107Cp [Eremothecium sinecaudum]AMD21749.1 HFL107Cp [Eremothecium sinecaudum]
MGNVPTKLEQDDFATLNSRNDNGQKPYRSVSNASAMSSGSVTNDTTRSRRATSVVGSLLSSSGMSRADAYGVNAFRRRSTKEREWSKELHTKHLIVRHDSCVDGGYLAPYGCYKLEKLDYDPEIVQNLIVGRKLAPFYTPLQEYCEDWTRSELIKVVDGLSLHAAYEEDSEELDWAGLRNKDIEDIDKLVDKTLSRREQRKQRYKIFKARLYYKQIMWQEAENQAFLELKVNAAQTGVLNKWLPSDDLKYDMYSNGSECPICFLYFPEPMNLSRCCLQPICTECFVQIKRKPPHFPHDEVTPTQGQQPDDQKDPNQLISLPASCPYCATPFFGVTYTPPPHRTLGILGNPPSMYKSPPHTNKKPEEPLRRHSVDHEHPSVVTSDMIRPDWETELMKERTKLARRAANATAIHVSNRLVDPGHQGGYSYNLGSGSSTFASHNSIVDELEEEMIRHAMRLSLLGSNQDTRAASGSV